jgi:hypothetical protein
MLSVSTVPTTSASSTRTRQEYGRSPRLDRRPAAAPRLRRRAASRGAGHYDVVSNAVPRAAGPSVEGGCDEFCELRPNRRSSSATRAVSSSIRRVCASISAIRSSRDGCSDPDTPHDQQTVRQPVTYRHATRSRTRDLNGYNLGQPVKALQAPGALPKASSESLCRRLDLIAGGGRQWSSRSSAVLIQTNGWQHSFQPSMPGR